MDTMLIYCTIFLLGVNVGSSLLTDFDTSVNSSSKTSLLSLESTGSKTKREIDKFNFGSSIFDDSNIFDTKNVNKAVNFETDDEDLSFLVPSSSNKVARSNLPYFETIGQNFDSSNFPSFTSSSSKKSSRKPSEFHIDANENQSNSNKINRTSSIFNRQTVPHFNNLATYPEYVSPKPESFQQGDSNKNKRKIVYNSFPSQPMHHPNIPLYTSQNEASIPIVPSNHYYRNQQSPPQYAPYRAQLKSDIRPLHHSSKPPSNLHNQQYTVPFQNLNQHRYDNILFTTASPPLSNRLKLTIPNAQTASNFPKYYKSVEPISLTANSESNLKYKTQPTSFINVDYNKFKNANKRSGTSTPFLSDHNKGRVGVLPIRAAGSSAQFPKYKGASLAQFPTRSFSKAPDSYQDFQSQSQLHFNGNENSKAKTSKILSKPLERIRSDVEIIDKKKPIPPLPKNDDDESKSNDDESGEASNESASFLENSEENNSDESPKTHSAESMPIGGFKSSGSFPYIPNKTKLKKDDTVSINLGAKFQFDKFKENKNDASIEKPVQSEYFSGEDDDESETQNHEKQEESTDTEHPYNIRKPNTKNNNKKRYEEDFDQSFKRKFKEPKFSLHSKESNPSNDTRSNLYSNYRKINTSPQFYNKDRYYSSSDESNESSNVKTKRKLKSKENYLLKDSDSDLYDENISSSYSREEKPDLRMSLTEKHENVRKSPPFAVNRYTTRPSFVVPPTSSEAKVSQNSEGAGYTTYISHGDWDTKNKLKSTFNNYNNPSNGRFSINSPKNSVKSEKERNKILQNLEGI